MNKPGCGFVVILLVSWMFSLFFSFFCDAQNFNYLPTSTTNQIVHHTYFSLSYSDKYEQAEWVAYKLAKERVENPFVFH